MADDPHKHTSETPLLGSNQNHTQQNNNNNNNPHEQQQQRGNDEDTELDATLARLERFLTLMGFFSQSSVLSFVLSWLVFATIGVVLPIVVLELSNCSSCQTYEIKDFELDIVAYQASLAGISLLCLSHNLRKYGLRKFLFVDRYIGQMARFRLQYIKQIKGSLRLLICWLLPCFLLKTAREVVRIMYVHHDPWWLSVAVLVALVLSWTYVSMISLTASTLFHLLCNLQVIHFDDYAKLLERESEVLIYIEEHIRLKHHLSKISHRFRIFLLLYFLVVTISQFVTLFQTTGYSGMITIINGGDFAVVGIIICLHAATRISHRAQGIASLASKWHALLTCGPTDSSQLRVSPSLGNLEAANASNSLHVTYSESDLESLDYVALPANTQLASYMSTYHKRQAFVMYLQNNPGGITIFGWTVDRGLLTTIFFIELSLITFVLGKTIVFSS